MGLSRVIVYGNQSKSVRVEDGATKGAQVGVNLLGPDGALVKWSDILNAATATTGSSGGSASLTTTDDLDEGAFNLYFTNQRAQDAVGGILQNTANITFTYDSTAHFIRADLTNVTVGSGGILKKYAFDAKGRLSAQSTATTDDLAEGVSNLYFTNQRVASALSAGPGITLNTDMTTGVTTVADSSLILANLTDQALDNLTDQSSVQLTENSASGAIPIFPAFTLATLPSAATHTHGAIFVSDLTGAPAPCYSDGTNWRRFSDNSIAS